MIPRAAYLWRQILNHSSLFFTSQVRALLNEDTVRFLPYDEAMRFVGPSIVIPFDVPASTQYSQPYYVPFNGTRLTLWNRYPTPSAEGWQPFPSEAAPLWHQHRLGTIVPAWNLFANLFDLLTFREERESTQRDGHGRYRGTFSPRFGQGILEVPAFNDAVAALAAACVGLRSDGVPRLQLDGLLKPPVIVLSHDCDILFGNDIWTQLVRAYRVLIPLARGKPPHISNLWWIARNALTPRRFYIDNISGMIDLERTFGFVSTFYLLNGTGGRFGARSGTKGVQDVLALVPEAWDVGVHYNYDTFLERERFEEQLKELKSFVRRDLTMGRAHYLRFDAERSLPFLESFGVRSDESAGYSDCIGYRCGIGGCFQAYDLKSERTLNICEIPMVIMDTTLVDQYGAKSVETFRRLLVHLGRVGGALSVLFHPGVFHNPEFPEMLGIYHRLLMECQRAGVKAKTAGELAKAVLAQPELSPFQLL